MNPYLFWSASEDSTVRQIDFREKHQCTRNSTCSNILVDLNERDIYSIALNQMNSNYFVIGGYGPTIKLFDRRYFFSKKLE